MIFLEGLEGMVVLHYLVYHLQSLHYYCFNLTLGSSMASSDFVVCWAGMPIMYGIRTRLSYQMS